MNGLTSDLVRDSKLNTTFTDDGVICHIVPERKAGHRGRTVEERWERKRQLGRGTFGVVWLERCSSGKKSGQFRAVKEIVRRDIHDNLIDYGRITTALSNLSDGSKPRTLSFFLWSTLNMAT
jgi:hypothetical protein